MERITDLHMARNTATGFIQSCIESHTDSKREQSSQNHHHKVDKPHRCYAAHNSTAINITPIRKSTDYSCNCTLTLQSVLLITAQLYSEVRD